MVVGKAVESAVGSKPQTTRAIGDNRVNLALDLFQERILTETPIPELLDACPRTNPQGTSRVLVECGNQISVRKARSMRIDALGGLVAEFCQPDAANPKCSCATTKQSCADLRTALMCNPADQIRPEVNNAGIESAYPESSVCLFQ